MANEVWEGWGAESGRLETEEATERFLKEIEYSGTVPAGKSAAEAAAAVLCELSRRLSGGEARDLLYALSPSLQEHLDNCPIRLGERSEEGEVFDRMEFLERVGRHFQLEAGSAQELCRAVFRALQKWLPKKEVQDIDSQLPRDLKALWQPSAPRY